MDAFAERTAHKKLGLRLGDRGGAKHPRLAEHAGSRMAPKRPHSPEQRNPKIATLKVFFLMKSKMCIKHLYIMDMNRKCLLCTRYCAKCQSTQFPKCADEAGIHPVDEVNVWEEVHNLSEIIQLGFEPRDLALERIVACPWYISVFCSWINGKVTSNGSHNSESE